MRYVTFYYSFLGGLDDAEIHENKEAAIAFYRQNAKRYFDVRLPRKTVVPTACGFPHRQFCVASIRAFNKRFKKGGEQ